MRARNILVVLACALGAITPAAASAATVTGTVPAEAAPQHGHGSIVVRALDPETARVVAGTRLTAPGEFTLEVPGGLYLVLATASDARGEFYRAASHAFRVADDATAQAPLAGPPTGSGSGTPPPAAPAPAAPAQPPVKLPVAKRRKRCKKPPPRCKRRRHAKKRTCRKAKARYKKCVKAQRRKRAGRIARRYAATSGRPAVGVVEFTVDVEGYGPLNLWHMQTTDVAETCIASDMDFVAAAASDLAAIDAEIAFQQGNDVDPSTRVDPSKRIHATHHISGEGSFDAQGNGTLTLHFRTAAGAHVTSVTATGHVFDVTDAAAAKLAELLCRSRMRVQFTGERRNRWQRYDCDNPGFNNYDGSFTYDTPEEKRFAWPVAAGDVHLPGTYSYTSEDGSGPRSGGGPTADWLNWEPAGTAMTFWLEALSFNPGGRVGFTTTRDELLDGPVTFPVNVTWNQTTPYYECTDHYEGYVTGTFTVEMVAKVQL